jgi:hypothetical protein
MPANTFRGDVALRIRWIEHGISSQTQLMKLITHEDGVVVAITVNEWRKMLPPLLVKREQQWYFQGNPVDVTIVTKGVNAR